MGKGIIIAGFSGIGKTFLGNKYKNVLDLDSAKFVYDDSEILHIPFEQRKGEPRKPNSNWPQNYIDTIKEATIKYDIVLVWDRQDIIKEYIKNDIEFTLCYPEKGDLEKYIERFRNRGNTEKYIKMKIKQYDEKMDMFKNLNVPKVILKNNKTLEEYLIEKEYKLIIREGKIKSR